ncbi:unnamed protein product [Lactuca saligna]|uniref:Uncharacterized protein n=1 Tax=Lactuca saligna TaxID=75948 RepID=A0AA35Z7E6_LACSI|nr:unnamed protein product [Lactuca saligna]
MMTKTTRSKGEARGSSDGSWRRGAALVAPSLVLSSFSSNISQRWRQREIDRRNTTGKGCLAVAIRPGRKRDEKEKGRRPFLTARGSLTSDGRCFQIENGEGMRIASTMIFRDVVDGVSRLEKKTWGVLPLCSLKKATQLRCVLGSNQTQKKE